MDFTTDDAKIAAGTLRADLADQQITISHSRALELVAHQLGYRDWNTAAAVLGRPRVDAAGLGAPVPVLRVQRFEDAQSFYLDYLGFGVEWEHRFEPDGSGSVMTDRLTFRAPFGVLGRVAERLVLARHLRRLLEERGAFLAASPAAGDDRRE